MARAVTKCPNCGSSVSQFAAGCAICGADLIAAREQRERRRQSLSVPAISRLPHITGEDALIAGLMLVVALGAPLLGGILAGLFAYQANSDGNIARRNLCLVAVAVALIMLILLSLTPGTGSRLFSPLL
jgi:hypothetical protein